MYSLTKKEKDMVYMTKDIHNLKLQGILRMVVK